PQPRQPSALDAIADRHVTAMARLDPFAATAMGVEGHDHQVPDLSPSGLQARADAARGTLRALDAAAERAGHDGAAPLDEVDVVTLAAMRERLGLEIELHDSHELHASLNIIASPAQDLREVFDLMP